MEPCKSPVGSIFVVTLRAMEKEAPYHDGWMGEISVPITWAEGYRLLGDLVDFSPNLEKKQVETYSPTSMAQIPVPVPISRIFCGLESIGARWSLSSSSMR